MGQGRSTAWPPDGAHRPDPNLPICRRGDGRFAPLHEHAGAAHEVLEIGELPNPTPRLTELRLRPGWPGVNPSDVKSRAVRRTIALQTPWR